MAVEAAVAVAAAVAIAEAAGRAAGVSVESVSRVGDTVGAERVDVGAGVSFKTSVEIDAISVKMGACVGVAVLPVHAARIKMSIPTTKKRFFIWFSLRLLERYWRNFPPERL